MRLTRLSRARQRSLTGDNGCTGAFFDPCRYLRSQYQSRHGLVRAWADTLRQRATLDDVLKAQHAGGFAHQPSMTALWLRTLCLRRWAGLSATGPQRADLSSIHLSLGLGTPNPGAADSDHRIVNGSNIFRSGFGPLLPGCIRVAFNDLVGLERALHSKTVAALIVEPIRGKAVNNTCQGLPQERCQSVPALWNLVHRR
jgi:hypothetical protein